MSRIFHNESELKSFCIKHATAHNVVGWNFKSPGNIGVPDTIFGIPGGEVIFVEFKHPNGDGVLSEVQHDRITDLKEKNIAVYACHTFQHFERIINYHLENPHNVRRVGSNQRPKSGC